MLFFEIETCDLQSGMKRRRSGSDQSNSPDEKKSRIMSLPLTAFEIVMHERKDAVIVEELDGSGSVSTYGQENFQGPELALHSSQLGYKVPFRGVWRP